MSPRSDAARPAEQPATWKADHASAAHPTAASAEDVTRIARAPYLVTHEGIRIAVRDLPTAQRLAVQLLERGSAILLPKPDRPAR